MIKKTYEVVKDEINSAINLNQDMIYGANLAIDKFYDLLKGQTKPLAIPKIAEECIWTEDYAYHYVTSCGVDNNDTSNVGNYCKWCGKKLILNKE